MTRALSLMLSATSLAVLVAAPNAIAAIGLKGQRVVAPAKRPAPASPLIAPLRACPGQDDLGLQNILGNYSQIGVSVGVGELGGRAGIRVWAQHFGSHCEPTG